ncbi:hypothetical protein [Parendozoicomonas sp. Alg238-R29]|uniref:hypothetical protein n=1 Tax=Parendozoicomonas sp. Alg238-R29 TaxID=2993446 RepID=UPI00248E8DB9|nr:hypothetical protein [Parendozoicomonas sp. Alg238-R29]
MDGTQVQYHPNSRIPLETLYPDANKAGRITVLGDVKGVLGHVMMGVGLAGVAGKEIKNRVPTTALLGGLVAGAAAITFLPIMSPVCCFALPALPAAGLTFTNIFGTMPMFIGGGYLVTKLLGAPPADKLALTQELPERRLLRRVANLGVFNLIGAYLGLQALGFAGNPAINLVKSGLQNLRMMP